MQAYVRPELLLEPIDAKLETLETLEDEGVIDGLLLNYWSGEVELSPDPPHSEAVEVFERFERWAGVNEVSLRPPFTVRTRSSEITGDERTVLSTPVMCLAVYVDERLAGVYPHTDGDDHYSVAEAIAALRTGDVDVRIPDAGGEAPADVCPDCEGALVNVQGLDVCHDCAWTETPRDRRVEPSPSTRPARASRR